MQCADHFDIKALHNHMCILTFKVCSVAIMLICWSILFEICKQCTLQSGMYLLNNVRHKLCNVQYSVFSLKCKVLCMGLALHQFEVQNVRSMQQCAVGAEMRVFMCQFIR